MMPNHPNRSQIKAYPFAVMLNGGVSKAFTTKAAAEHYLADMKKEWPNESDMKFELVDRTAPALPTTEHLV